MSNWNNASAEERIVLWRSFREEIAPLQEQEQLNRIAEFFADIPIGSRCLDYYTPSSWPTPWEILHDKMFCPNTISLLIFHTLNVVLGNGRAAIILIEDDRDRYLVPLLDNKYIFNFELGMISTVHDPRIKIIDRFEDETIDRIR
jgi:hypothetical protein